MTSYACLEQIAADVACLVPDEESIVHVEVEFDRQPFEVKFASTPYDRERFYSLALRTPRLAPPELIARVRPVLCDYFTQVQELLAEEELVFLRVSVTSDGSFFMSQSTRQRPIRTEGRAEQRAAAGGGRGPGSS